MILPTIIMIRYNLKTLIRYTDNNPMRIFNYIKCVTNKDSNMPNYVRKILNSKLEKNSFILHNKELVKNRLNGTELELYWYIYLAGLRNFADFAVRKQTWLDARLANNIALTNNRLITLINNEIHFKYEEK